MGRKQRYGKWSFAVGLLAIAAMLATIFFCFSMIYSIRLKMNESASSNLLNTTKVIKGNLENYIDRDMDSLNIIGELYKCETGLDEEIINTLAKTMGFEWILITDKEGNSARFHTRQTRISDLACYSQWEAEKAGYSDAYYGDTGRLQTTMWVPVYDGEKYIGTVFGNVILTKYYSADVFTFYEGAGRTYLFDSGNGTWILKSLGTDGVQSRQNNIYSLLLYSGNQEQEITEFRNAVEAGQTGIALMDFNGEQSYICFMPLPSSKDWYVATVIGQNVLLREANQIQLMIQLILMVFSITIVFSVIVFLNWQIRKTKLNEAEERDFLFSNISANIDSAFLIYEKKNRQAVFVSDNVKRLLGLEREQFWNDAEFLFDWCGIERSNPLRNAFLEGTLKKQEIYEVCMENEVGVKGRYLRLELIPADRGQEIAVLTDVTADKDIQRSLLEAMEQAEAASHAKNDFLSAMSHDIRTPMNGIIGMTAIAAAHLNDRNRVKDCLAKINDASAHLLNIINEILDMSRIENGKMKLSEEPFNVAELLQEVVNMNFPGICQKHHMLNVHIHSMNHEDVIGDPVQLRRIVENLISNAIKYTPEGGQIKLGIQELPPAISGFGCYEICVEDNGIGMSREFQKRLFQPFERDDEVRSKKIQGTGLGMSIVKNMVVLMMGDIQVESEIDKGSLFRVTVNLLLDNKGDERQGHLERLPVLVVDDDLVTCETVTDMLCDIGMIGEWADNGHLAISKVMERHQKREDYLAVLLDWKMPKMDGVETARRIRASAGPEVPIIILTAYDWSEIEEEARLAGVDSFLSKPLYKTKLRQKMLSLMDGQTEQKEKEGEIECHETLLGRRVLLAEDNELNLEIAVELLKMLGMKMDTAKNGAEALQIFADSSPDYYDLILMDIQMPEMNGYEAARFIRALDRPDSKSIPIIAMTADAFLQDIQSAHEAGMNEHISKPVSVDRLIQVLKQVLGNDRQNEEIRKGAGE